MRKVNLKVLLPILCSIALLFSVVGSVLAAGAILPWRDGSSELEKILDRDGYIEGIWYPWFQHSYLGHCLAPNKMVAQTLGGENWQSSNWMKVGLDQYGAINIYREIYNLKALGFNLLGYEGSPYGEGVIYDDHGNVLGIEEEYITNVRRLLDMCKEIGMPVLWTVTFHSTTLNDYYADGKYAWDIIAQAYANADVADQYAENFVKPLCKVLAEYPETVVMVASGVELENEINDSDIGNHFDNSRLLYGVTQDSMLYFLDAVTDAVKEVLPNVPITNCGNSSDHTIYEGIDLDFLGRNYYNIGARAPKIDELRAAGPTIVTEFGLGDGVAVEDEVWTIKQINFRDNFIAEGHRGWMYWDWSNTGFGGAYDLLAAGGQTTTDFRAGAFAIHYYIESYRAAHRGEELTLDKHVLFCNKGSGTVEWISSRQATSLDLLRSLDGGKTWTTLLKGVAPTDYEENFKGQYVDTEVANMQPDGTKVIYKMVAYDDNGNVAASEPSNEAEVTGPPVNVLADYNCSFENGMEGWNDFGANGTFEEEANYSAKVITPQGGAADGEKALEFKLNYETDAEGKPVYDGGKLVINGEWSGINMNNITVKPNTPYRLVLKYKIAPDAIFEYEESDQVNKMSGYLFIRGAGASGEGHNGPSPMDGSVDDATLASLYMLRGSKNEWREDEVTFKTNDSDKLGLDFRAVLYGQVPNHYYIDSIELYEIK